MCFLLHSWYFVFKYVPNPIWSEYVDVGRPISIDVYRDSEASPGLVSWSWLSANPTHRRRLMKLHSFAAPTQPRRAFSVQSPKSAFSLITDEYSACLPCHVESDGTGGHSLGTGEASREGHYTLPAPCKLEAWSIR
jgi:hypothetical protein